MPGVTSHSTRFFPRGRGWRVLAAILFVAVSPLLQAQDSSSSSSSGGASSVMPASPAPKALPVSPSTATPAAPFRVADGGYHLRSNDMIRIVVFQEDDLTTETRISKGGTINFPLIGQVRLTNRTVDEVTAEIRTRLDKDYIVNPQVTLMVLEFSKQWVTVLGEVQKPGQVEIPPEGGLDLLGAIALAGGYTRIANPGNVIVRRVVDGHDQVLKVDAKQLSRNSDVKQFQVYPGDTINVGQSLF